MAVAHVIERPVAAELRVARLDVDVVVLAALRVEVVAVDVDVDAADRVDRVVKALEVDVDDVVDVDAEQVLDRLQCELRPPRGVRGIQLVGAVARDLDGRSRGSEISDRNSFSGSTRRSIVVSERPDSPRYSPACQSRGSGSSEARRPQPL